MKTPKLKTPSLPVRTKNNSILRSPLFLIANTVFLVSNLALTKSDQKAPECELSSRDYYYPADVPTERRGETSFESENPLDQQGCISEIERKYREKLMETIDPKIIRPVYKIPPKTEECAEVPIEL